MAEFLELIESIEAEKASVQKLFSGDGASVHALRETRGRSDLYLSRLTEAAKLLADVFDGRRPSHLLREAMTTSDFPLLFADIIDRQMLQRYQATTPTWQAYVKRSTVPDFRDVNRFAIDGGEGQLLAVAEQAPYPQAALTEARYHYGVSKYGRKIQFSWETLINDDLGAFQDIPDRLARAARRSEDRFATNLHVDANGPDATFYSNAHLNKITVASAGTTLNNPVLGTAGLQEGMWALSKMVDSDGEPIAIDAVILEVPPALEITARNLLNAMQIILDPNVAAGTAQQQVLTENWMRNRVSLVVNPYIPIRCTGAVGATCWFLHASPTNGRPAFEMGFLRGHEAPEIFIKEPNARRVGGGVMNPLDGDFENDTIEYKVRHVFGGTTMEPKASVASFGTAAA